MPSVTDMCPQSFLRNRIRQAPKEPADAPQDLSLGQEARKGALAEPLFTLFCSVTFGFDTFTSKNHSVGRPVGHKVTCSCAQVTGWSSSIQHVPWKRNIAPSKNREPSGGAVQHQETEWDPQPGKAQLTTQFVKSTTGRMTCIGAAKT
uniref:Uncharacterized protein n=1 Tax=Eutreptiella gymnastica TaxID=73025 RepID=A0A7S4CXL5_9EUGL|mmetsp:Transcript_2055/g.3802  ORF Transcript_2055/g.3802 Transcript_2055/m.3802 type:complete len:148 (-) Transcript_2055:411-854(-)